jgi:hypothetical protein
MTGSRCVVWVSGLCAALLNISIAQAAGSGSLGSGTISFVGAVVAPTCMITTSPNTLGEAVAIQSRRQICPGPGGDAANAARIYTASVVRLSSAESDPVLKYFDHYVKASGLDAKDPVLVTQTYE